MEKTTVMPQYDDQCAVSIEPLVGRLR